MGARYPLQIAGERILVKRNNEMLEKALHPQKPGKRKIFLESGSDNYGAAGNIEHHVVQICNFNAADTQRLFFGARRSVRGAFGMGSAKLTFRIAE